MDRGIWVTWYDLPEEGKEEFLSWLHEKHLPEVLKSRGYLWAAHVENIWDEERKKDIHSRLIHTKDPSIPAGNSYTLLFGAETPYAFLDPSPAEMQAQWTTEEREMLGRRVGVRSCIFAEACRVDGPSVDKRGPGLTPGPIIQVGSYNLDKWENEEEMGTWYAQSRLKATEQMSCSVCTRKLVSVSGWAKHGIMYEFTSLEGAQKEFMALRNSMKGGPEWGAKIVRTLVHAPGSPSQGPRIWPPVNPA